MGFGRLVFMVHPEFLRTARGLGFLDGVLTFDGTERDPEGICKVPLAASPTGFLE